MSQEIITLPKQLANQIAAGEVVERPLSVVKELLENSLDAGATDIQIELENGGINHIKIKDNGLGIPGKDLKKALEKYSTSKIRSLDDLYKVMTFGFRGEALASISSVSEFTIASKPESQDIGVQLTTDGGESFQESEVAHNVGTTIDVGKLFFNTPARKSYLKTPRTEYQKILDYTQKMSLCFPRVAFSLSNDGKNVLQLPQKQDLKERIYKIYDQDFVGALHEVSHDFGGMRVSGYITDPKVFYTNRNKQALFVNNRYISSPMISKAIYDAYNRFIPPKQQAGYILFLEIDPTQIDANVHPRKMEMRFAAEQQIYRIFYHAIKDELERVSLVSRSSPSSSFSSTQLGNNPIQRSVSQMSYHERTQTSSSIIPQYHQSSGTKFKNYSPYTKKEANPAQAAIEFTKNVLHDSASEVSLPGTQGVNTSIGRVVGQVHNAYIIVETEDGLKVLDQHALAERVIYEKLQSSAYTPLQQKLLTPISLGLDAIEEENYETHKNVFYDMGFEIEKKDTSLSVLSVPDFVSKTRVERLLRGILSDVSELGSISLEEVRHKIWAYAACRSAIKFGDPLTYFEMEKLLEDASIEYSSTCPHGRPVVYDISLDELLNKYER